MKKKSIWGAIFLNSALAVALAIFTIVSLVPGLRPGTSTTNVVLALRVNDEVAFEEGKITFTDFDGEVEPLANGNYVAKSEGEFSCTVVKKDKSKVVYDVTVYGYGKGTAQDPYNITKADHLFDLSETDGEGDTIYDNLGAVYAIRADIDLAGRNWVPVGRRYANVDGQQYGAFTGTILGNKHSIKNMTISVDADNFADFASFHFDEEEVDLLSLEVGFIGVAEGATINGLTFDNASVEIASNIFDGTFAITLGETQYTIAVEANRNTLQDWDTAPFLFSASGVLAGDMVRCKIGKDGEENAVKVVNSSVVAANTEDGDTGVGLLAGSAMYSNINNIVVENSTIEANGIMTKLGGLIGVVYHYNSYTDEGVTFFDYEEFARATQIANVSMSNVTIVGDPSSISRTAGVVAEVYGAEISNVSANGLVVKLANKACADKASTMISGGVCILQSFKTEDGTECVATMKNVAIDAKVQAMASNGLHEASGVVSAISEDSVVTNAAFAGTITASKAGAIALFNYGTINYTEGTQVADAAITVKFGGAGVAYENHGTIAAEEGVDAYVNVELAGNYAGMDMYSKMAEALGIGDKWEAADAETRKTLQYEMKKEFRMGGVAAISSGKIDNMIVDAKFTNPINAGGIVSELTGYYNATVYALRADNNGKYIFEDTKGIEGTAEVSNIEVNAVINTVIDVNTASTIHAAGAVAVAESYSKISNISVRGNVNDYATTELVSGYMVAGLVAEMNGSNIELSSSSVDMNIKVAISANKAGTEITAYVAGAVAYVNQTGANIVIADVDVVAQNIQNNVGSDMSVYGETDKINFANSGAFGLVARIDGDDDNKVLIDRLTFKGNVSSHTNATAAFGAVVNATINQVVVESTKVEGYSVAGMFLATKNVEIEKSGSKVGEFKLASEKQKFGDGEDDIITQLVAGFVATVEGNFAATNCYAEVENLVAVADDNSVVASFAIHKVDGDTPANATYKDIICYVIAQKIDESKAPFMEGISETAVSFGKPNCTNVKLLGMTYVAEDSGLTIMTENQLKGDYETFKLAVDTFVYPPQSSQEPAGQE